MELARLFICQCVAAMEKHMGIPVRLRMQA